MGVAHAGCGRLLLVGRVEYRYWPCLWVRQRDLASTRAKFCDLEADDEAGGHILGRTAAALRCPRTGPCRHRGPTPAGCASPPRAHGPRGPWGVAAARARATQIEPAMQRRPGTMELTINNRCEPNPMRPVRRCPLNLLPVVTRYRLGRKIGSGSFGDIYLATNIVRYRPASGILSPILPRPDAPCSLRHPRGAHACLACAQRRGGGGEA